MRKRLQLKVCGMRDPVNVRQVLEEIKPDYMGFIFYEKSPRYMAAPLPKEMYDSWPSSTQKVGVFVKASIDFIQEKINTHQLDILQLHGDESPEEVEAIKKATKLPIIKVFRVGPKFDLLDMADYEAFADYFLFDTKSEAFGGTGEAFSWKVLHHYPSSIPFFLSGGVDVGMSEAIQKLSKRTPSMKALDVNSKFESSPGIKDIEKLKMLINQPIAKI